MKSKYYTEWVKNDSTTSKRYDSTTSIFRYDLNTPTNWNKTFDIKTNIDSRTVDLINQAQEAYLVPSCLLKELPNHNKTFSERFKVFYSKDTYVLVDTKCGLLAKVKKNKELINDIEIAVLYLILKGFIGLKTSRINKLISVKDKPIKGCLYELADQYDVVMYVNNGYSCKAIPKSTKRMVKCLIDNAECNGKEDSKCVLDKIVEKLKTKQEDKPKPSVFKDGEERPKLPEGFTYLDDDVKDYIFSQPKVSWEDDWGEEIITKYLNEVMKK